MSRRVRYLGTAGRAELWHFADVAALARTLPRSVALWGKGAFPRGVWAEVDGLALPVGPEFGAEALVRDMECTGRAAKVLRGLCHHAGAGL